MPNRKHLPRELLDVSKRSILSSKFAFASPVTMVSYVPKPKKNVLLISTLHRGATVCENSTGEKPEIILYYNETKAGVDTVDQMCRYYSTKVATRRWPLIIFFNMLDIAALNAFTVYCRVHPEFLLKHAKTARSQFLRILGLSLASEVVVNRPSTGLKANLYVFI